MSKYTFAEISRRIDILTLLIEMEERTVNEAQAQVKKYKAQLAKHLKARVNHPDASHRTDKAAGPLQPKQGRAKEPA